MDGIYRDVNNGVYRAGFAPDQKAYEAAYQDVFRRLELTSERLADRRSWSATPSRRRTSGSSPRWCGSTRCTTATSSATAGS
ncbi:hypothetical protein SALBM135S_04265 [Streptomyces alboniger]